MHANTRTEIRPEGTADDAARPLRVGHQHQDLVNELRRTAQSRMAQHHTAGTGDSVRDWMRRLTKWP